MIQNAWVEHLYLLNISPPARWWSLDFNKGAAPPSFLPSFLASFTRCHYSRLLSAPWNGPGTISPAPNAVGPAWARTPYCQLQMLRGKPGPEHHVASSRCCGARLLRGTPGPEHHVATSTSCGARLDPNTISPAPDAVGHAWAPNARENARQNVRIDARYNARKNITQNARPEITQIEVIRRFLTQSHVGNSKNFWARHTRTIPNICVAKYC